MHKPTRQHAGFTLVELMVSISILSLMLFLINEIFNNTSLAVTSSVQNAKVIAQTRVTGEQLGEDAQAMVGPNLLGEGGYIVIIQQRLRNVTMLNPSNLSEATIPEMRSDQFVFIRDAAGLRSITPQDSASYRSNLIGQSGDYAKVWYGHVTRTLPNGEPTGAGADYRLGGINAGFDRIGSDWIMGRQALLMNPTDEWEVSKVPAAQRPDPTVAGAPGAYTHADNAFFGSTVQNVGSYSGFSNTLMGLTDVTRQRYLPLSDPDTLTYQLVNPAVNYNTQTANYLNTAYRFADSRLRVNTAPNPADTNYASWAIAQGHAILAPNTSEIVIDFAADLNGNGRIDVAPGGNGNDVGPIYWYDALDPALSGFNFAWQRSIVPEMQPFIASASNNDTKAFVFRIQDAMPFSSSADPSSNWPYLIRIRYRLHDSRGRLTSNDPGALTDQKDNNGDGAIDEEGEDKISGRWYEHIIRVPRPDPQ